MSGEELRALAEQATPGPWTVAKWHGGTVITERWAQEEDAPSDRGLFTSIGAANDYDAAFIAAANPTAVLALLDRLEAAEDEVHDQRLRGDRLRAKAKRATSAEAERDALRAQVERVEMVENTWLASASETPGHMRAVFMSAAEDLRAALDGPK